MFGARECPYRGACGHSQPDSQLNCDNQVCNCELWRHGVKKEFKRSKTLAWLKIHLSSSVWLSNWNISLALKEAFWSLELFLNSMLANSQWWIWLHMQSGETVPNLVAYELWLESKISCNESTYIPWWWHSSSYYTSLLHTVTLTLVINSGCASYMYIPLWLCFS